MVVEVARLHVRWRLPRPRRGEEPDLLIFMSLETKGESSTHAYGPEYRHTLLADQKTAYHRSVRFAAASYLATGV